MKFHELSGSLTKPRKRVGRGISSGHGKTAGRGTKGQNARTGGGVRPGFEGGQNPLMHRLPKRRGFKSLSAKAQVVHTDQLNQFSGAVGVDDLAKAGLITDSRQPVRVLSRGEVTKKLQLSGMEASQQAESLIKKTGGTVASVKQTKAKI